MLVRVSPEIRARIDRDARRARRSLSAEAELVLRDVLRPFPETDKSTRALCYLVAQLGTVGPTLQRTAKPEFNWRKNRFDFEAFKLAIIEILERLAPAGEPADSRYPMSPTPEDLGLLMAAIVLSYLTANRTAMRALAERTGARRGSHTYAFPKAADDLDLRTGEDA
jgi:hypothetical protein